MDNTDDKIEHIQNNLEYADKEGLMNIGWINNIRWLIGYTKELEEDNKEYKYVLNKIAHSSTSYTPIIKGYAQQVIKEREK